MTQPDFEKMVSVAIDNLPDANISALDNVAVITEDWPTPEQLGKVE